MQEYEISQGMTDEAIKTIADQLIANGKSPAAYFGIAEKGEDYFFEGNQQGMHLFAAEVLYASINDRKTWGIQGEWFDGTALEINRIERTDVDVPTQEQKVESNITSFLLTAGCAILLLIFLIFLIVGAIDTTRTVFNWF